jgi:hypothetical protein
VCIIVISCSSVAGIYTVPCLTARNMDNSKYEFCSIKLRQCRILWVLKSLIEPWDFAARFGDVAIVMHRITTFRSNRIYDGGHIRLYYDTIVLQLPTVFGTVTCCTGL